MECQQCEHKDSGLSIGKMVLLWSLNCFWCHPGLHVRDAHLHDQESSMYLEHFALHPQKQGCLLGTGTGGERASEWRLDRGYRPKMTRETVDHHQNNGSVKAVSPHHCAATSCTMQLLFQPPCWAESQGQCPLHCCCGMTQREKVQLSQPSSSSLLIISSRLTWTSSSTSLQLISPGTLCVYLSMYLIRTGLKCVISWLETNMSCNQRGERCRLENEEDRTKNQALWHTKERKHHRLLS